MRTYVIYLIAWKLISLIYRSFNVQYRITVSQAELDLKKHSVYR